MATGELTLHCGTVEASLATVYCPQRTDDPLLSFLEFLDAADPATCELKGRLSIADEWGAHWPTLSHGERKRAQIGVAL